MVFYIVPEIRYAIGLADIVSEPMMIITGHEHPAIALLRKQGIEVWCAEEEGKKTSYNAPGLLRLSAVQKLVLEVPVKKRKLLTFKISPPFTLLAEKLEAQVLMPSYKLNRFWEDKSRSAAALAKEKIPVKQSRTATLRSLSYRAVAKLLAAKNLVVQKPHGMAGNSTYFVNNEKEWKKLTSSIGVNPLVKVSPFLEGTVYTVNCLLSTKGKALCSYPMLQITGDERFTRYPGGTCGLDMTGAQKFKKPTLTKIEKVIQSLAKVLHKAGFWGWFGVDFVVSVRDAVTVLEINPRFTASISIFTQAQNLQLKHSFWQQFLDEKEKKVQWMRPLLYTSLLLRNITEDNQIISKKFTPGIYTCQKDTLLLKQESVLLKDLKADNEYLIIAKGKDSVIHPDGEFATIVTHRSATQKGSVDKELAKIADLVKMALLN
ncbi:MAG: ATP-grasp domain-containing protein [Candidatus Abawacabacteria bacterium]|nr:ATP-grasp domain-containing protein [Candidatus Abawacabacteria bacterium]